LRRLGRYHTPHPMSIEEQRQADRFRFLKRLYDISGADKFKQSTYQQVGADIGVSEDEASSIAHYLADKNLIRFVHTRGGIAITANGVDEVERALTNPRQPTTFFPPVINIINVATMTHSQIQQGTVGSSQSMTISGPERDAITRVLNEVREIIASVPLSPEQQADVEGNAATVEAQLRTSKPSRGMIREALDTIAAMLAPFAAAATVVDALVKLAVALGAPGAS
jgi:hypothetical protein